MTQDRYMSRGRVHIEVAELLDDAVKGNSGPQSTTNKRHLALFNTARYHL